MHLNKKVSVVIGLAAVIAGTGLLIRHFVSAQHAPAFRFTTVQRGDLQALVSATGTLNAVTTVSVGTQVSGQVSALLVDFNDHVKKGQLLARIDPTIAQQGVADAQANLEKAQAQANQASRDQKRNRELSSGGLIARSTLEQGRSALKVAQADVKSASVALQRAKQNLSFTSIYSPIDGVVVERNVNNGQTVAASLSAPQLFLIANDLSHMQILAQVGESDIELIKQGQSVKFTVQALPGQTASGSDSDDVILIPYTTAATRLTGKPRIPQILASTASEGELSAAQDEIKTLLRESHHITGDDEDDFTVRNQTDLATAAESSTRVMTLLMAAIASISLLVGGIGIMNIMLVSVTERTREIGICLALGARGSDVLTQFLVESIVMGVLGGIGGLVLGITSAKVLAHFTGWETNISPLVMIIAVGFSGAVGVFFGFYPAQKAAALRPIEALRYE